MALSFLSLTCGTRIIVRPFNPFAHRLRERAHRSPSPDSTLRRGDQWRIKVYPCLQWNLLLCPTWFPPTIFRSYEGKVI